MMMISVRGPTIIFCFVSNLKKGRFFLSILNSVPEGALVMKTASMDVHAHLKASGVQVSTDNICRF